MTRTLLALLLLLSGCASGIGTETHRDPGLDVASLETFSILPNSYRSATASKSLDAARGVIESAITDALVEKGYRRAVGAADFEVEYIIFTTEHYQEGVHDRYVFDGSVRLLGGAESQLANPVREGNLHVHLLKDGKPFYEAIASGVIDSTLPVEKRIRATVPDMLEEMPPRGE